MNSGQAGWETWTSLRHMPSRVVQLIGCHEIESSEGKESLEDFSKTRLDSGTKMQRSPLDNCM